jgi:hypothetical protein
MSESILSGLPRITFPSTTGLCNNVSIYLVLPGHFQIWNLLTVLCDCWRQQDKTGAMFRHTSLKSLRSPAHNFYHPNSQTCCNFVHTGWLWFVFCSHYDPAVRINVCTWFLQSLTEFTLTWFFFSEASFHVHRFVQSRSSQCWSSVNPHEVSM